MRKTAIGGYIILLDIPEIKKQTADAYIEKASNTLASKYNVKVATSDNLEQMIIFSAGALRLPALDFEREVKMIEKSIEEYISKK